MSADLEPVTEAEHVYRRVHCQHYKENIPVPVLPVAFRPVENDTTGLSVFREQFLAHPAEILSSLPAEKRNSYYIARLEVRQLRALGLTVVPEPDAAGPAGHAVVPELSWQAYQADKHRLKGVQVELAKLASSAIVHRALRRQRQPD